MPKFKCTVHISVVDTLTIEADTKEDAEAQACADADMRNDTASIDVTDVEIEEIP